MAEALARFRLTSFAWPRDRVIGDCQVAIDHNWVTALEVMDTGGRVGVGFALTLFGPPPPVGVQARHFLNEAWPSLTGQPPASLVHRVSRARGGNIRPLGYDLGTAIDQALWDLAAKQADMPLWRYLGGREGRPFAYASGLEFHLDDGAVDAFYQAARIDGYGGYKIKVGHPDARRDLARLRMVRTAVGDRARLMADANEAWTVAETRRRVDAFRADGIELHWVEDPVSRDDATGLRELRHMLGGVRVNAGEYLPTAARAALLATHSVDVLQLNGRIGDGMHLARLAAERGVPVALGNSNMNVGAHLAAALPEVDGVEDARMNTTDILVEPIGVAEGRFILTERPGHGLELRPDAVSLFGGEVAE